MSEETVNVVLTKTELERIIDALEIQKAVETTILQEEEGRDIKVEDPLALKIAALLGWDDETLEKRADETYEKLIIYDDLQFEEELVWRQATIEADKEIEEKKLKLDFEQRFELACQKYDAIMQSLEKEEKE